MITRLEQIEFSNIDELRAGLKPTNKSGLGYWVDLSGLIIPKYEVDKIFDGLQSNKLTLDKLNKKLKKLHVDYYDMEWTWAYNEMESYYDIKFSAITKEELVKIVNDWKDSVISIDNMLYDDAQ